MKRLLKLSIFLGFFLFAFLTFAPNNNLANAATCSQLLPTGICISTLYRDECYRTATGASDCTSGQICCQPDPTPTPRPSTCSSPNQCMYTQCSPGFSTTTGTCSSVNMVCCKPAPCNGTCINSSTSTCITAGSGYCNTIGTTCCKTVATCGVNNNSGTCETGKQCVYSGSYYSCVWKCSVDHQNGYCPTGSTCQYQSPGWGCSATTATKTCAELLTNGSCVDPLQASGCTQTVTGASDCTSGKVCCSGNIINPTGTTTTTEPTKDCYIAGCETDTGAYNINAVCDGDTCETGIGPINTTDFGGFARSIFSVLLGFSGLIATILIIISGYKLVLSRGNPEKVQDAKEQLSSAIVGLLFIIFALVFLEFIGLDILGIPRFY